VGPNCSAIFALAEEEPPWVCTADKADDRSAERLANGAPTSPTIATTAPITISSVLQRGRAGEIAGAPVTPRSYDDSKHRWRSIPYKIPQAMRRNAPNPNATIP